MKDLLPFIFFACSSSFTPGPNNFMLMNSGSHLWFNIIMAIALAASIGMIFID